jgi:hypothetical protein
MKYPKLGTAESDLFRHEWLDMLPKVGSLERWEPKPSLRVS